MSRKRHQRGHVCQRGRKAKYWEGSWRDYLPGNSKPERRSVKLGNVNQMSYRETLRSSTKRSVRSTRPVTRPRPRLRSTNSGERIKH